MLFYPVTEANFATPSYQQFAEGYHLCRDAIRWFWDQYTNDEAQRNQITAPASSSSRLPPALVITGEADVLHDEGEAYANNLRQAGVPLTAVRHQGIIHDFVIPQRPPKHERQHERRRRRQRPSRGLLRRALRTDA